MRQGLVAAMWVEFTVIVGILGAGAIWWLAYNREGNAAAAALRKQQFEKRSRFNRGQVAEAVAVPANAKPKARSFGNR